MDLTSIIGLILGFGLIEVAYAMDGGNALALWLPSAFILVVGGSTGAIILSYGFNQIRRFPAMVAEVFAKPKSNIRGNIEFLVLLSEGARKEGLLSLEKIIDKEKRVDPLLKRGVLMVIDGMDSAVISSLLDSEVSLYEQTKSHDISMFDAYAGYTPAMGMIGTIIGLIQVLQNMSSPEELTKAIGIAFLTTLYGVLLANLFFIPVASKLRNRLAFYRMENDMIIEGVCAIRDGINPKMLREKLLPYAQIDGSKNSKSNNKRTARSDSYYPQDESRSREKGIA